MNAQLLAPFCNEEIEEALHQMFPTKAPRPDGFPALFYPTYWEIVGAKTIDACLFVLNNQGDFHNWNNIYITLVRKTH